MWKVLQVKSVLFLLFVDIEKPIIIKFGKELKDLVRKTAKVRY